MNENEVQTVAEGQAPEGALLELNPLQQVQPEGVQEDAAQLTTEQPVAEVAAPKKRGPKPGKKAAEREAARVAAEQAAEQGDAPAVAAEAQQREPGTLGLYKVDAAVPDLSYGTDRSACFDLRAFLSGASVKAYSAANREYDIAVKVAADGKRSILIPPGSRVLVPSGYVFDIPAGYKVEVYPRSGTSLKLGIALANSVAQIDEDYTQQTFILLANNSDIRVEVEDGERVAQAALEEVIRMPFQYLTTPPNAKGTRAGGMGSTGTK